MIGSLDHVDDYDRLLRADWIQSSPLMSWCPFVWECHSAGAQLAIESAGGGLVHCHAGGASVAIPGTDGGACVLECVTGMACDDFSPLSIACNLLRAAEDEGPAATEALRAFASDFEPATISVRGAELEAVGSKRVREHDAGVAGDTRALVAKLFRIFGKAPVPVVELGRAEYVRRLSPVPPPAPFSN
jgi:hypothetical protein